MKNSYLKLVKLNHYLLDLGQNLHPVSLLEKLPPQDWTFKLLRNNSPLSILLSIDMMSLRKICPNPTGRVNATYRQGIHTSS